MTTKSAFKGILAWTAITLNQSACNGQPTTADATASNDSVASSADTPQVDVRVNKQYDEHGNLIVYDSTYSSVYTGRSGDAAFMDSVFKDFMPGFGMRYPFLNDPGFNSLFFPDSSFHQDFFNHDFFRKRMEMNQQYMRRMMEQMDSLKNQHFQRGTPSRAKSAEGSLPGSGGQGGAVQGTPPRTQRADQEGQQRRETVEL